MPPNTWIKLRSGILEPKHRERLGIRIWLYLYMLDRVDWETGTIEDWRDKDASEELQMPTKTITRQRQEIADAGYITCRQSLHRQVISITNWQDPRSRLLDEGSHDTQKCVPSDHGTHKRVSYGTHKRVPYGPRKVSTIYLNPHINKHIKGLKGGDKPPSTPRAKSTRDGRLSHPALTTYREVASLHIPKVWRDKAIQVVGEDPENIMRWRNHVTDWIGHGWNKANVKGMLESFATGGIKSNGRGKNKSEPAGFAGIREYLEEQNDDQI